MIKKKKERNYKQPLTYSMLRENEQEIRNYIDSVNKKTGIPKGRIATDLILAGIKSKGFFCTSD
ncbi:MAG: hypothetical protein RR415_11540 [Ruthenibacterium sp.]